MRTVGRRRRTNLHLPRRVYWSDGAHWYVDLKGKWHRLPAEGPSTLAAALTAYARFWEAPKGVGMPALIETVLRHLETKKPPLARTTLAQYRGAGKILARKLAQYQPHEVQPVDVAGIKTSMRDTPNMANRCLSVLRQIFDYALENKVPGVTMNPAIGVKRHAEGKRDRLITAEEYARIYAHADTRLQVVMDLAIRTGQRVGSILKIERSQLLEEGIRFPRWKTDSKGIIAWTPELRAVVERAKGLAGTVASLRWLIPGIYYPQRKADYRSVKDQWDKACAAAGVEDAHLHDLRAVAATSAKRQGKDAQALLLHTSPQQTARYLRGKEEPLVEGPDFGETPKILGTDERKP